MNHEQTYQVPPAPFLINPYGKKRRPMIRYAKAGKPRLVIAGGVGLRGWWNDIITEQFLDELQANLASTFSRRVT